MLVSSIHLQCVHAAYALSLMSSAVDRSASFSATFPQHLPLIPSTILIKLSFTHTVLQSKLTSLSMYAVSSPPSVIMSLYVLPCHTPECVIPSPMWVVLAVMPCTLFLSLCISTCTFPSISDPISPSCVQVSHAAVVLSCVKKVPVKIKYTFIQLCHQRKHG